MALDSWIFGQFWKARNNIMFEKKGFTEQEVCLKIQCDVRNWQEAQHGGKIIGSISIKPSPQGPIQNAKNYFVDAAWNAVSLDCGLCWDFFYSEKNYSISRLNYAPICFFGAGSISTCS